MPPIENTGFRRILFCGRAVAPLPSRSEKQIEVRHFLADSFEFDDDQIAVLLYDASLSAALSEPPPPELAARDRPYKKAVPDAQALEILRGQAPRGLLDADLLELFTAGRIYERAPRRL